MVSRWHRTVAAFTALLLIAGLAATSTIAFQETRPSTGTSASDSDMDALGQMAWVSYNFTDAFRDSFNSWHTWMTNYTQDLLSNVTGGPVIQGPLASMNQLGNDTDPSACDFQAIRQAQSASGMAVFEARGSCIPSESCIAAFLAAAEPGT